MHIHENQKYAKRSQFRETIRRKQISHHFQLMRMNHACHTLRQQQQSIRTQLQTREKRELWAQFKGKQLNGRPSRQLFLIFKELSLAVPAFKNELQLWTQNLILDKLLQCLLPEHEYLRLGNISACVLQQIFYSESADSQLFEIILQKSVMVYIVNICRMEQKSVEIYFSLLNTILQKKPEFKKELINLGFAQLLIDKLNIFTNIENEQTFMALSVAFRLARQSDQGLNHCPAINNVISVLIPVFVRYLCSIKNKQSLRVILKALASITKIQNQHIISMVFNQIGAIDKILQLINPQSEPIARSACSNILVNVLSSENQKYSEMMLQKNLLDILLKNIDLKDNHHQFINNTLKILSNIISNNVNQAKEVINHSIFDELVLKYSRKPSNKTMHQDSIYTITTLLSYKHPHITQQLINKKVVDILIESMAYYGVTVENCIQIIMGLGMLTVYMGQKLVVHLQSIYNINRILQQVEDRLANQELHCYISWLMHAMYGK